MLKVTAAVPGFPADATGLPTRVYKQNGFFEVNVLSNDSGIDLQGWVSDKTKAGSTRRYLFAAHIQATTKEVAPTITISLADPKNGNSFGDRDGIGKPIREIRGLPQSARKDIREKVSRIARYVKDSYIQEQQFLAAHFSAGALDVARTAKNTTVRIVGDWLVSKFERNGQAFYSASFITPNSSD
jgi:hypothetical protein